MSTKIIKWRFSGLGSLFGYHEIQDKSGYNFKLN